MPSPGQHHSSFHMLAYSKAGLVLPLTFKKIKLASIDIFNVSIESILYYTIESIESDNNYYE